MAVTDLLAWAFYAATFLALGYFVHKVLWLTRFRVLQAQLVREAASEIERKTDEARQRWQERAVAMWNHVRGDLHDSHLVFYAERTQRELETLRGSIAARRVTKPFVRRLDEAKIANQPARSMTALELTRIDGDVERVEVTPTFGGLEREPEPDAGQYDLALRSRYGFLRRALALFLGAADVVYSSQHLARMSQNTQVPTGVILRRLSLIVLILLVVMIDIITGARKQLIAYVEVWMGDRFHLSGDGAASFVNEHLPTVVALVLWLAGYGLVYIGLYAWLYSKSQRAVRRLKQLRDGAKDAREQIFAHHATQLRSWVEQYAQTLDEATDLTVSQATMQIDRVAHRLRRRIVIPELLTAAEKVSRELFKQLPEASTQLQDVATTHKHSLAHELWPRVEEMGYQKELARYRSAWQYLEATISELRGELPDPASAVELWATLVGSPELFPELELEEHVKHLDELFASVLTRVARETPDEVNELNRQHAELCSKLRETFAASAPLVASRVELTQNAMRADLSKLSAEILRAREQARLEAMAFEI